MDLDLLACEGLPEHSVISINSRPTRQVLHNGPCSEPFKLRAWPWPLRIDLYRRLGRTKPDASVAELDETGCCTLSLVSADDRPMSITFRADEASSATSPEKKSDLDAKVNSYFSKHKINDFMRENFDLLIAEKPDDPFEFLAQRFRQAAARESPDPRASSPVGMEDFDEHRASHGPEAVRKRARASLKQGVRDGNVEEIIDRQAGGSGSPPLDRGLGPIEEGEDEAASQIATPATSPAKPAKALAAPLQPTNNVDCDGYTAPPKPVTAPIWLHTKDSYNPSGPAKSAHVRLPPAQVTARQRAKQFFMVVESTELTRSLHKAQQVTPRHRAQMVLTDASNTQLEDALAHSWSAQPPVKKPQAEAPATLQKSLPPHIEAAADRLKSEGSVLASGALERAAAAEKAAAERIAAERRAAQMAPPPPVASQRHNQEDTQTPAAKSVAPPMPEPVQPKPAKRDFQEDEMISAKSVGHLMPPSKEDFGYNTQVYGKAYTGGYGALEREPAEEPMPAGPSRESTVASRDRSRPESREFPVQPGEVAMEADPGNHPVDYDELCESPKRIARIEAMLQEIKGPVVADGRYESYDEIHERIARTEAMIAEIKAQQHQAMMMQEFREMAMEPPANPHMSTVGNQQQNDHSPRLPQFVPNSTPGETPRLSHFVPTEASTADTPRCSQFCPDSRPDSPELPKFMPTGGSRPDSPALSKFMPAGSSRPDSPALSKFMPSCGSRPDSPALSKFMPAVGSGAMRPDSATTPRLSGMVPSMDEQQFAPTLMNAQSFLGERGYPDPSSASLPRSDEGTPRLSHLMPDVEQVQRPGSLLAEAVQYPRSNDGTPRLSGFVPDLMAGVGPPQASFENSHLSSFMPVGSPLGCGSTFTGQRLESRTHLSSPMTAQQPIGRAFSPMGMNDRNFSGPYSNEPSADLEQFMPESPLAYNRGPQSGLAADYAPRLSHCVPQLR